MDGVIRSGNIKTRTMIYSIDFKEVAGKISHVNVSKYLKDLGWNEFPTRRQGLKIFQIDLGGKFYQVNLPIDRNFSDYNISMYKAVECIAMTVSKSTEQVLLELLNPLSDILRIRIKDRDRTSSTNVADCSQNRF